MKTTLLIMAAGIGSRFGTGIKQLAKVDSNSHIIIEYSALPEPGVRRVRATIPVGQSQCSGQ